MTENKIISLFFDNFPFFYVKGDNMALSKRLISLLRSSPSTMELPEFLANIESEGYDDTVIQGKISDIEDVIGDEETAASILGRIKALEDAQTPAVEQTPAEPNE